MTTTSEILNRAADLIEEKGWTTGIFGWGWDGSRAGYCIEGAIAAAAGLTISPTSKRGLWECPAYQAVADYLEKAPSADSRMVWAFNDALNRTAPEVIEVLRASAVIEASRERQLAPVQVTP